MGQVKESYFAKIGLRALSSISESREKDDRMSLWSGTSLSLFAYFPILDETSYLEIPMT
jgi:hypothetical protein